MFTAKDPDFTRRYPNKAVFEILTVADFSHFEALAGVDSDPDRKKVC